MNVAAVIMAGGRGERFWPSSREDRPKQFLTFDGKESLLQKTAMRMHGLCSSEEIWVVTREDYAPFVKQQLPEIPLSQILMEPEGRDTAPCVALASAYIHQMDPETVMVMLPSDHLVLREDDFRAVVKQAITLAQSGDYLVTIGIRPTRPETGYGYIRMGKPFQADVAQKVFEVSAFKEKPAYDLAVRYLLDGQYLWNSGIFVWRASVIQSALERFLPDLVKKLHPLKQVLGTAMEGKELRRVYGSLPRLSIDYGVMEQAPNTVVVPADFGWDDLGTWTALERVLPPDGDRNIVTGRVLAVDTTSSILHNSDESRLLVTLGLSDIVVVDTADVVLVADKSRVSDLKQVVQRLDTAELKRHLRRPLDMISSSAG